jgi:hypothetical protein
LLPPWELGRNQRWTNRGVVRKGFHIVPSAMRHILEGCKQDATYIERLF